MLWQAGCREQSRWLVPEAPFSYPDLFQRSAAHVLALHACRCLPHEQLWALLACCADVRLTSVCTTLCYFLSASASPRVILESLHPMRLILLLR